MISQTLRTVLKSKVPSGGQPTLKLGHSVLQKITIRDFLTSTLIVRALALTSLKWLVTKLSGENPDWVCPIVSQSHNEQTRQHTRQITECEISRKKVQSSPHTGIREYRVGAGRRLFRLPPGDPLSARPPRFNSSNRQI